MNQWMKPMAWVVSYVLALTQAMPMAHAAKYLRQPDTGESAVAQHEIRNDKTWVWGPGSQDLSHFGRTNLVSLGRQAVGPAFLNKERGEGAARAFPILGPHARPIDELVEEYAARYPIFHDGRPLSAAGKTALKEKLEFIKAEAEKEFQNIQWAVTLKPGELPALLPALDVVRFVPILDETGTGALHVEGIDDDPLHVALIAYGGQHRFKGWDQSLNHPVLDQPAADGSSTTVRQSIGPKHTYVDLDQMFALLTKAKQQREAGALVEKGELTTLVPGEYEAGARFSAATLLLHHEVNNLARGHFERDLSANDEAAVNAAISETFDAMKAAQAAKQAEYLKQRKAAAERRADVMAKQIQIVPYVLNLGQYFANGSVPEHVVKTIETRLAQAARDSGRAALVDAHVIRFGPVVFIEAHHRGPQRNPAVDRLVIDVVTQVLEEDEQKKTITQVETVTLKNGAVEARLAVQDTVEALRQLAQADPRAFRELVRLSRDPYRPVPKAETLGILESHGLAKQNGEISDVTRNVVLAATEGLDVNDRDVQVQVNDPIGGTPVALTATFGSQVRNKSYHDRLHALVVGPTGEFPIRASGSDALFVSVALDAGPAAYNWVIMRLLDEAVQNQLKIEGTREDEVQVLRAEYERYQKAKEQGLTNLAKELEFNAVNLAREAVLGGPGYVVVVENIADILAGKQDRRAFRFTFPRHAPFIHTLVDDQTDWVITKVLPGPGSRRYDKTKSPEDQAPIVSVMVDRLADKTGQGVAVMVGVQQSGAPALGEFNAAATENFVTTAGPGAGTYHRGTMPVTLQEADRGAFAETGRIRMASYSYMLSSGLIPHHEVQDQVAGSTDVTDTREGDENTLHDALVILGSFDPGATAPEAERRGEQTAQALGNRWHEVPTFVERDAEGRVKLNAQGKPLLRLDPVLAPASAKAKMTMTIIKADIGATGHQKSFQFSLAAIRATMRVAQAQGLIEAFDVSHTGDDIHIAMWHRRGERDAAIHDLSLYAFFRAGWTIRQLGYPDFNGWDLYGHMQDFVGPEVKELVEKKQEHRLANLTPEFIDALEEELEWSGSPEYNMMPAVRRAFADVQQGIESGTITPYAAPGNVAGMGAGNTEQTLSEEQVREDQWATTANDKAAASAFNFPAYWTVRAIRAFLRASGATLDERWSAVEEQLLQETVQKMPNASEELRRDFVTRALGYARAQLNEHEIARLEKVFAQGIVLELMEVKTNARSFLDVDRDDEAILSLLSSKNDYNLKRIWPKQDSDWIDDLTPDQLADIERQVDQELRALREDYAYRKAQLKELIDSGKKEMDEFTPWEQAIYEKETDQLLRELRPRFVEALKALAFMAENYAGSISTESLSRSGGKKGGTYYGKDDSVMIAMEALTKFYRAIRQAAIDISIGNARGSHKPAMLPVARNGVAMKWSNPIETSQRYTILADGSVLTDPKSGMAAADDVYGQADFDEVRKRVNRFNRTLIRTQGGFTIHGPHVDSDVEPNYPARQTRNQLVAADSPFGVDITASTIQELEQGQWVKQFPQASGYVVSKSVAGTSADLSAQKWVVVHASVYDAVDAGIVHRQIQEQLKTVLNGGESALRFALVVDGTTSVEDAEKVAKAFFDAIPDASGQTVALTRDDFTLVLPGLIAAGDLVGRLEAAAPGSTVGSVIGPKEWAQSVKSATPNSAQVAAIAVDAPTDNAKVVSGAKAIIAGVEAAATAGQLSQQIATKLDVREVDGFFVPATLDVNAEVGVGVTAYQDKVRSAKTSALKG